MFRPQVSILISSFERLEYFKRTLYSIVHSPPSFPFEIIVADEQNKQTDFLLAEMSRQAYHCNWKFVVCDSQEFTKQTGVTKYFNNPAWTNNVAFKHCGGNLIFLQGNETIAVGPVYDILIEEGRKCGPNPYIIFSSTFNCPDIIQKVIGDYGEHLSQPMFNHCLQWPLQHFQLQTLVTNYISLTTRNVWEDLNGYDERYLAGIGADDSCFTRRVRALPNSKLIFSKAISLHQDHKSKTMYKDAEPDVIEMSRWNRGVEINRALYHSWDGITTKNEQSWEPGKFGIKEIITNGYKDSIYEV